MGVLNKFWGKTVAKYADIATLVAGNSQISAAEIATGAVTAGKIAAAAVGGTNIGPGVIVGSHITSVNGSSLVAASVTPDKLSGAIVGSQISSVNGSSIVNSSVTGAKFASASGSVACDGTLQVTIAHGLGAIPSLVSLIGIGGSCTPIMVSTPGSTNIVINSILAGTVKWYAV